MKNALNLFFALVVIVATSLSPARAQFEGIVESKNLTVDERDSVQAFVMTIWIGKGKLRIHNSAIGSSPPSTIIYRNDKGIFWVLNEEDKTYIEVLHNPEEGKENQVQGGETERKPDVRKTGKVKKILGFSCEQYIVRRSSEVTEIWGTKQLSGLLMAMSSVLGSATADETESWSDELTKMGIYPLVAKTKVDGNTVESQEVTKVEKRTLSQDLFELPPGYTRQQGERGM